MGILDRFRKKKSVDKVPVRKGPLMSKIKLLGMNQFLDTLDQLC